MSVTCVTDTLAAVVSPHGPLMLLLLSVLGATVDWLAKYHFLRPPRKNVLEFKSQAQRWSVAGTACHGDS